MPFVEIKGLPGKVYIPEKQPDTQKKNKCPDCFSCQMCSDTRCRMCLNNNSKNEKKVCTCGKSNHENKNI